MIDNCTKSGVSRITSIYIVDYALNMPFFDILAKQSISPIIKPKNNAINDISIVVSVDFIKVGKYGPTKSKLMLYLSYPLTKEFLFFIVFISYYS